MFMRHKSQNHSEVEKVEKDHLIPAIGRDTSQQTRLLKALPNLALNPAILLIFPL